VNLFGSTLSRYKQSVSKTPSNHDSVVFDWIDEWDFKNCQTKQYTHGFHTYPITGNITVKGLILKTDEIICEFGENLGLARRGILYRNILNKRTPLKNSPTNEPGKTGDTMSKESIVLLKKD
jgi:hypothetical protein